MTYNPNHLSNANAGAQAAASMLSVGIGNVGGKPITSTAAQIQSDFMKEFRKRDDDKPSGLGAPTTKVEPEEDDRNLDQKIYDFFVGAGADMEPKEEEPMYMMDFYGGPMFVVPEPAPVERQVLSSPFDEYNVETYNFGGYYDTRDTSPSIGSTVDPDMQDPRRGLMAAPTMSQPSTPEELTDVPRALAMSAAVPTKTYTIKSGDTLSEIARDNNTTVKALMSLNTQIEKADEIDAGATIQLPLSDTQAALRRGLGSEKDMSGVQVASTDPEFKFYQSGVPLDQRIFEPEDTTGFGGMGPDPSTGQGIMTPRSSVPTIENSLSDDDLGIPDTDNYMGYLPSTPAQKVLNKIAVGEGAVADKLQRQAKHGIGTTEYDMVYNYGDTLAPDKPITQMTIQEVFDYQKKLINATKGKVPGTTKGTSAVGKYQFVKTSLFGPNGTPEKPQKNYWADKLKLTPDMKFTPALQEKIARLALKETGYDNYVKGKKSQDATINRIADIWASVEGNTYGQGTGTTKAELAAILDTVQPDYMQLGTP